MAEMNPQRLLFKEYYTNPVSETFNLIRESALRAGFSESYAKVLLSDSTGNDWIKNIINNYKLKTKGVRNLEKFLDDDSNLSIQADMTKFVLKTLGKEDFSEKSDLSDLKVTLQPILVKFLTGDNNNEDDGTKDNNNTTGI